MSHITSQRTFVLFTSRRVVAVDWVVCEDFDLFAVSEDLNLGRLAQVVHVVDGVDHVDGFADELEEMEEVL